MSSDTFSLLIEQLLRTHTDIRTFVLYHAGEPFLNKNFFEFVDIIKSHWPESFVKTVSNGSLLSETLIDQIVSSQLDQIQISIDGTSPYHSDEIRRGSNTMKLISNINSLALAVQNSSSSLSVEISTTQFFSQEQLSGTPFTTQPNASWLREYITHNLPIISTWAMKWPRVDLPDMYRIRSYDDPSVPTEYATYCDHVCNTITIRSDGSVVPCCYDLLGDLNMGNIHSQIISEIWNSVPYNDLRVQIRNSQPCLTCKNCNTIRKRKFFLELSSAKADAHSSSSYKD